MMTDKINGLYINGNGSHLSKRKFIEESIILPDFDNARITKLAPNGKTISYLYEDVKTLVEMVERGRRVSGNGRCMGWRTNETDYSWITYDKFLTRAKHFGSGLLHLGLKLGQSTFVGICGRNSVEWVVAQYGCLSYSSAIIPLLETLRPDDFSYMVNLGEVQLIVCEKENKVKSILDEKENTPSLKHIVCVNKVKEDLHKLAKEKGVEIHLFEDVENSGRLRPIPTRPPKPNDVANICFTSGTTGMPKGVVMTHKNIISGGSGLIHQMGSLALNKDSVVISYLPLAHVMEQTLEMLVFINGGCIGFWRGDIKLLFEDIKVLRPTFFPAVPRLLNKLYNKAQEMISSKPEICNGNEKSMKDLKLFNCDAKLYEKFLETLGGRVKLILSAAAPISTKVLNFYHKELGLEVIEVYGQTESSGPCSLNVVSDTSNGNVGPPIACCMIKLEDVPHLGYFKENDTGEICVKGPNVCKGYLKEPEKTAEVIDEDGWLHTGDVGMWLPNGTLKVIDRKKHIFKLSQGEYVAPEKIENVYLQSPYIAQIFVDGDSTRPFLVAVVIPNKEAITSWYEANSECLTLDKICEDPVIEELIMDDMKRVANINNLLSFEQAKKIHLHPKLLTHEEGHLTSTSKTKRDICRKHFAKEIQELYEDTEF